MPIKNILVSYNGSPEANSALNMALVMAERYNAHITGILAHGLPNLLYAYGGHVPQSAMDQLDEVDKLHREKVRKTFMETTDGYRADHVHFLDVYGEADEMLMDIAIGYDLVIMGPTEKNSDFPHMQVHPDVIARNAGKPVIVVPGGYNPDSFNDKVLLAWDGKRAASKAMSDAIGLLKPDAEISLLCVGAPEKAEAKALPAVLNLERHGFKTKLITKKANKVAKAILSTAESEGAGMLVMGAYEHAKLREDLFGGVTNTVLKKTSIPVLLSH